MRKELHTAQGCRAQGDEGRYRDIKIHLDKRDGPMKVWVKRNLQHKLAMKLWMPNLLDGKRLYSTSQQMQELIEGCKY